jgi:Flp pilus assembly protein TadB
METPRRPPVIDMTPDGEFRDPAPPRPASALDRALARVGGIAVLVALAAGGIVLAGLAIMFAALALPVLIIAGAIGAASIWWRLRRARRDGRPIPVVIIRR